MRTLLLLSLIALSIQASAQVVLPANMYADTLHSPFWWGVASGDPLPDGIVLWTKVNGTGTQTGTWELADDSTFSNVLQSGSFSTDANADQTVLVEVNGLSPGQHYWYRFLDTNNQPSVTGRTKTSPATTQTNVRLAVASCSSVYSGFFNAYRRIGERNDIDCMVHLGDYIYDFVDSDEEVRVPDPYPSQPNSLQEWRDVQSYHLLDPDLRLARQQHPWVVIWDNHDINTGGSSQDFEASAQAFREYVPLRQPDPQDPNRIYRSYAFGDLIDLIVLDYEQYYHDETLTLNNTTENSALSNAQRTWLLNELSTSTAQWRIVANQKMMSRFSVIGLPAAIPFGDGPVADSSAWDGHNLERTALLNHLADNNIDNTLVLSGDIHTSFITDLPPDYNNYNSNSGAGSAAVEFIPTSISRGNFDEAGFGGFLATLAQGAIALANPNHIDSELESHGYGIVDIRPDRAVAEFWYSDKLSQTNNENFAGGYQVLDGENHWERNSLSTPTQYNPAVGRPAAALPELGELQIYPSPVDEQMTIRFQVNTRQAVNIRLVEIAHGGIILEKALGEVPAGNWTSYLLPTEGLAAGTYLVHIMGTQGSATRKITVQH